MSRQRVRLLVIGAVLAAALGLGAYEVYMRSTHVYETDARITADIVTMSSRAEGWLVEVPVREGMRVEANQVVARIDDRTAKLRAEALKAQIEAVKADRSRLMAERQMIENQADAKARTRASGVKVTQAARDALDSDILLANQELERSKQLYERRVITDKQLETAQAAVTRLENTRRRMDAERTQAEGALAEALAERDQLAVIDGQIAGLVHAEANLQSQLRQQLVDVEDRTIRSPIAAVIDRTFMLAGEYVGPGQRILMLHDPNDVWIEANIKETRIRYLRVGQPVSVTVDAYPNERFVGRVARIGSSTTARFALLPTPNPSGNFTKITQRVPVKIDLVEKPKVLAPGMMVEIAIDVR
ncbi:MAG: HlyD family secretion protein [Alphaproteobacteria bacterium]|nr:HlyD family secretion protein [Alphaproteobacteria bacterium]MCW5743509.1 HlyD family secretion protein [Alphaproteobacteria bacterium]